MKIILRVYVILLFIGLFSITQSYAAINFTVTPIRYELKLDPGESITLPASIRNNGTGTVVLPTASSDFITNGTGGSPSFVRRSELVFEDQQLSSWITIADSSVSVNPGKEVTTTFTINVPENATPGGHYAAVFFKNDNSVSGTTGNIGINVDYGVLVLVQVSGEIIVDVEIDDPIIYSGGRGISHNTTGSGENLESSKQENTWYVGEDVNGNPIYQNQDICSFGDFTPSKYDGKCIDLDISRNNDPLLFSEDGKEPLLFSEKFEVSFSFPISNKGNTHIKPEGKIILKDEDGNIIKSIGKESIENENGAIIGEKIVDYIPINDEGGNILPLSKRIFQSYWKGFPYKGYDDAGNPIISYWNPSEYYTQKNKKDAGFLMFWERVSEVRQNKTITADISLIYYDEKGNPIEFNTAKEFPVQYIEQQVTLNPYVILGLIVLFSAAIMLWFACKWWVFLAKRKHRCWNCHENIKAHWKTCPYCKAIQNKKEHERFQKQQEQDNSKPIKKIKKK